MIDRVDIVHGASNLCYRKIKLLRKELSSKEFERVKKKIQDFWWQEVSPYFNGVEAGISDLEEIEKRLDKYLKRIMKS